MYADASFGPMIELGPFDQTKDVKVRSGQVKEKERSLIPTVPEVGRY